MGVRRFLFRCGETAGLVKKRRKERPGAFFLEMEAFGEAAAVSLTVLISGIRGSPIRFYGCSGRFGRPGRRAGDRGGAELGIVKEQGLKPESFLCGLRGAKAPLF